MTTGAGTDQFTPIHKDGLSYNTLVRSPSETKTSLQIVCFFDIDLNDHYQGGTHAVNEHFNGAIHDIRISGIFKGRALETLLISPVSKQIPAEKLLLIGLGDPGALNLNLMEIAGYTAVMEAVKAGVKDFCFAPSLKDAGITMSFKKTDLSQTLANGMHRAFTAATSLAKRNMLTPIVLKDIYLLAGQAQAENSYQGLKKAFGV
jgi:hypothetical protein